MEMDMEDDFITDNTMFCPNCRSALYPTDDGKKYFLMLCRACKYEDQLDYEFSWEKNKVNKKSILSHVRKQERDKGTCCLCAVLTSVETRLNYNHALENKGPTELLSLEHLAELYSEEEERKTGSKYDDSKGYKLNPTANILKNKGVFTAIDFESKKKKRKGKRRCKARIFRNKKASFVDICQKIVKGNAPFTSIPVTEQWIKLKSGDMYIADTAQCSVDEDGYEEWHAIVLIGFGRKGGVNYFRFQNSRGYRFCDIGIGTVRASEIDDIVHFEPYFVDG